MRAIVSYNIAEIHQEPLGAPDGGRPGVLCHPGTCLRSCRRCLHTLLRVICSFGDCASLELQSLQNGTPEASPHYGDSQDSFPPTKKLGAAGRELLLHGIIRLPRSWRTLAQIQRGRARSYKSDFGMGRYLSSGSKWLNP